MQGRKQALLSWLTVVAGKQINNINDLKNCLIIEELLTQIQGFVLPSINDEFQGWKLNYKKMKSIYDQLEQYFRQNLKCAFPSNLSIMNMVQMSKGESQQGLQSLLLMIFIVCIRCPSKEKFIPCIMQLSADAQEQLMQIIQQSSVMKDEREDYDIQINSYKQQIARIQYLYQNLSADYRGLRLALDEDDERMRTNEQNMKRLVKQNQNLVKSLAAKSQLLRQKTQKQIDHYSNSNDDLVDELKKTIIQQQNQYGQQILRLKEVIQNISEQLTDVKRTNHELLQEQSRNNFVRNSDQHINCISIDKYKIKVSELTVNCKQSTQREMAAKLQNVKLKNLISELQMKNKRLTQDIRKRENQFLINSSDGNKLKMEVLSRLRDSLKKTVMEQKNKNNKINSNEKIDFFDQEN